MQKIILIIDDEPDTLELVKIRLEAAGYKALTAPDHEKAFSLMEKHLPDLVLLDVMMPGKSGYEVCNEIKSDERMRGVPVILFTAKSEQKARLKTNAGFLAADDYILKPFEPGELLKKIKKFIG